MNKEKSFTTENLTLAHTIAAELLQGARPPHKALSELSEYIIRLGNTLSGENFYSPKKNVWIARTATVAPTAVIGEPCIVDEGAEIRHCAFVRGAAIIGKNAVVGNSTELKNVILFDGVQAPHYNYVGDSVIGYKAHLGAGAITSNVKSDKTLVCVDYGDGKENTVMKKLGAILGDGVEVGCGTVLNPGTVVGRDTRIYPLSSVRGFIPAGSIYKSRGEILEIIPESRRNDTNEQIIRHGRNTRHSESGA